MDLLQMDQYNRPTFCKECGGVMVYKGVGEYQCEDCKAVDYDDYGKVRLYIERNKGATAAEAAIATGVPRGRIMQMLKDERLQISAESKSFLKCELCGQVIRAGRFCSACEARYNHNVEAMLRETATERKKQFMSGHSTNIEVAVGEKRFKRDK